MKIKPKQYAEILFSGVDGKDKKEVTEFIGKFFEFVRNNNDLGKLNKIIEDFMLIWNRENKVVTAKLISSRPLSDSLIKDIKAEIKELARAEEVELDETEDKSMLGGVVLKYGDKVLDGSLRTRINELKEEMSK